MDIKQIQTIVAIADHGSFQGAARSLGMSVSNASLQIRALEKSINTPLFDRRSRPPTLTDAGLIFVSNARLLLIQWSRLNDAVVDNPNRGALKLGAVHTAVAGAVSLALGRLRKREPGLFLQLNTALTTQLIKQLETQSIDCAIVTKPVSPVIDMRFIPIAQESLGVIAHKNSKGESVSEILVKNPYLRFNRRATLAVLIDEELKRRQIQVNAIMEITTLDAIESLVKNGLGVSVVPVGKTLRTPIRGVRVLPFTSPPASRLLGVMVRQDCPRLHLVETLICELRRAYGESAVYA